MGKGRLDTYCQANASLAHSTWDCTKPPRFPMEAFVSEWLAAGQRTGEPCYGWKELEEQQQALLKSVICAFNQLLDLR